MTDKWIGSTQVYLTETISKLNFQECGYLKGNCVNNKTLLNPVQHGYQQDEKFVTGIPTCRHHPQDSLLFNSHLLLCDIEMGHVTFETFMSFLGPVCFLNFLRLCVSLVSPEENFSVWRKKWLHYSNFGGSFTNKKGRLFIWYCLGLREHMNSCLGVQYITGLCVGQHNRWATVSKVMGFLCWGCSDWAFMCKRKSTSILFKLKLFSGFGLLSLFLYNEDVILVLSRYSFPLLSFFIALCYLFLSTTQL